MKRRKWDAKTKATIVLEGLKGKPVTAICQDSHISQAQYYQWRDQVGFGTEADILGLNPPGRLNRHKTAWK